MALTITGFTANWSGSVTLSNPGTQTNPCLTWTWRSGAPVAGSYAVQSPNVATYQMPVYQPGDQAHLQRVRVTAAGVVPTGSVFSATVPSPPPPVETMTLTNLKAAVTGSTVVVTVDCTSDVVNVTLQEDGKTWEADKTPVNGVASWTVTDLAAGTHTLAVQGYNVPSGDPQGLPGKMTAVLTTTVTITGTTPPPPPVAPTNVTPPIIEEG